MTNLDGAKFASVEPVFVGADHPVLLLRKLEVGLGAVQTPSDARTFGGTRSR